MACHRRRVDVPSRVAPGHGEPCSRSQVDVRPGADVRLSTPKALQRQRAKAAGDQRQADDIRNEGEAREIQEQAGVGIGDHCGILEPADPQANRLGRVETCRRSHPQFATAPLLG
ncbi:unnamed protein product [Sphagnum balticum]